MITIIKWHVAKKNTDNVGYSEEAIIEALLDEDYSAFRKGFPVLSERAQKVQDALNSEYDTVFCREINGKGLVFPHEGWGSKELEDSLALAGLA